MVPEDESDDPTKTPLFKIAAWIVLIVAIIGLIVTVTLS